MRRAFLSFWTLSWILLSVLGCSSGGGSNSTSASIEITDPCTIAGNGSQLLEYQLSPPGSSTTSVRETLNYEYEWDCNDTSRTLSGNGVPNHPVTDGVFATKVSAQTVSATFPRSPSLSAEINENLTLKGYALNSVAFDPATAGTCPSEAQSDANCDYAMGSDPWNMEALPGDISNWKFDFGADASNAHVQPTGTYHYHGIPEGLLDVMSSDKNRMILVGWAADGFPIYARYGYTDPQDNSSALKIVESSYQLKESSADGRPSTTFFPLGHFTQDWEYVDGSGDLDECNGREGVTPEYPEGTYHYFVTDAFPFVQRCVHGTVQASSPTFPPPR